MATFIVNTLNDENDGITIGAVSLRDAINAANLTLEADTITFDNSVITFGTITLSNGELVITNDLTIDGDTDANPETQNITVDGVGTSRVFNINDGNSEISQNVSISELTISGGAVDSLNTPDGGGGISNTENLSISNSIIANNIAFYNTYSVTPAGGGSIRNTGTISISSSTIFNNTGGGIRNLGTVSISDSTLTGNSNGGVLNNAFANVSINNSIISGNTAIDSGGIENTGTASIVNSIISSNSVDLEGGGIENFGEISISNSTITGNSAALEGGGIYNIGIANISNSTISNNSSGTSGGGIDNLGTANVVSTIVATNTGSFPDVRGQFTDQGNNLIGDVTGSESFTVSSLVGDSTNPIDPLLGSLQDNGGSTFTQALLSGSPAINTGSNLNELTTDQRGDGFVRESGGFADIGAFENQPPDAVEDTQITQQDTPVTVNILANDTDPENDPLTIESFDGISENNGTITLSEEGQSFVYTPAEGFTGIDTFTYTINDGNGGEDTATVTITVNPINIPPDAVDDTQITQQDTPVTVNILDNDTDAENDLLVIESFDEISANSGTITLSEEGQSFVYTPAEGFTGIDTFTYTIIDGNGGEDAATVTITVNPINIPPDAVDDTETTQQDTPVTVNILDNDTDPENDLLTIESFDSVSANNGTITLSEEGQSFVYTPAEGFTGIDTFTYTINDGNGGTDTAAVTINIFPNSLIVDTVVDEIDGDLSLGDVSLREAIAFTNDGGTVTFANSIINQTITLSLGELVVDKSLTIDADIDGDSETRNITVDGAGASRVFNIDDDSEAFETVNLTGFIITGGTANTGGGIYSQENLSVINSTISNSIGGGVNSNGSLNIDSSNIIDNLNGGVINSSGTADISNSIISGNSAVDSAGIENFSEMSIVNTTISNNTASYGGAGLGNSGIVSIVSSNISSNTTTNDGGGIFNSGTATLADTSIDSNSAGLRGGGIFNESGATFDNSSISNNQTGSGNGGGVYNQGSINLNSSTVSGNLSGNLIGLVQGSGAGIDNRGSANISNSTISSNSARDVGGGLNNSDLGTANISNSTISRNTANNGSGGINNNSENTVSLVSSIVAANIAPTNPDIAGIFTDNGNNLIGDATGSENFIVSNLVGDSTNPIDPLILPLADNGGSIFTQALRFASPAIDAGINPNNLATDQRGEGFVREFGEGVDIGAVEFQNQPPVAIEDENFATDEDTAFTTANVLANDIDPDDNFPLSVTGFDVTATLGTVTDNGDGTFHYDPNSQFESLAEGDTATDTFTYTIADNLDNPSLEPGIVTITILGVNDAPILVNEIDNQTGTEGIGFVFTVPNNTFDDIDIGDILTLTASNLPSWLTFDSETRTFVGIPGNEDAGTFNITVTATDLLGTTVSDSFDLRINNVGSGEINPPEPNNPPILENEILDRSITPGELIFTIPDNTFNDVDAGDILTLSVADLPSWLTFDLVTGTFTGTPTEENLGTVSITVTATDSSGASVSDTFDITVILDDPSNNPPIAVNDSFTTNEDTPFITANILANDIDPENDPFSLVGFDVSGTQGIVTDNGDGTFGYNPNGQFEFLKAGEITTDSFTYTIQDTAGNQSVATVLITLVGVNDSPDAVDDTVIVPFNQFTAINVLANDLDPDNDPLSVTLSTLPTNGTATLTDNIFIYTPNPGFIGSDSFLYNINDGNGGIDTASVTVNIVSPGSPIAVDDNASTSVNQPVEINVLLNDFDPDGDPLTINTFDLNSDNGGIITENNGVLVYTPALEFIGDDRFTYTITDGINQDTATVTVSVEADTDEPNDTFPDAIETGLNTNNSNSFFFDSIIGNNFNLSSLVNDVDLFKLQLNAGDWLTVDVDTVSLNSGLDSVLRLFDEAGNQLAISDDNFAPNEANVLESYLGFSAIASGTYYIGVSSFGNSEYSPAVADTDLGSSIGTYNIEIDVTPLSGNLNGSFETGDLRGWQSIGDTLITTEEFGIRPNNGNFHTLVTNRLGSVNTQELENFLNLTPGRLDRLTGSIEGSAIQQTVTATAGTQLSFNWRFLTNEVLSSNDIGFVSIKSEMQEEIFILENISPNLSSTPYGFESLSGNYSFTFPTSGTYTVGIGVVDVSDQIFDSALLIDNVSVV